MMPKLRKYGLLIFLLGCVQMLSANSLDSLLKEADFHVYERPQKAIDIGWQVYNDAEATLGIKVSSLIMISTAYASMRQYERSLDVTLQAKDLLKGEEDYYLMVMVLNKLGGDHEHLRIYDKALSYLDEARDIALEKLPRDSIYMMMSYNYAIRGFIYREQMNCEIAITYFDRGIAEYEGVSQSTNVKANLSIFLYNKANCLMELNMLDSAIYSFEKSEEYAVQIGGASLQSFALKGLAKVYMAKGQYQKSIETAERAIEISENVGDLVLNGTIYKVLSDNYLVLGKWPEYQHYNQAYLNTQKEILSSEQMSIQQSLKEQQRISSNRLNELRESASFRLYLLWAISIALCIWIGLRYSILRSKFRKYKMAN